MTLEEQIRASVAAFESLNGMRDTIALAGEMILSTLRGGGKLITCGNGGSAAEASHFATELVGRYARTRRSLPAVALSSDGSLLSCIGNDFGYDHIFARQLTGLARPGDLLVVLSSSGNSANIELALKEARGMGLRSIAMLGRGGGRCRGLATLDLIVPGDSGRAAQEAHLFLIHAFCESIDAAFPST